MIKRIQIAIPQTIKRYSNNTLRFERIGDEKNGQTNNIRKKIKRIRLNSVFKTIVSATFMVLFHRRLNYWKFSY
jgi:hypothetical protein